MPESDQVCGEIDQVCGEIDQVCGEIDQVCGEIDQVCGGSVRAVRTGVLLVVVRAVVGPARPPPLLAACQMQYKSFGAVGLRTEPCGWQG